MCGWILMVHPVFKSKSIYFTFNVLESKKKTCQLISMLLKGLKRGWHEPSLRWLLLTTLYSWYVLIIRKISLGRGMKLQQSSYLCPIESLKNLTVLHSNGTLSIAVNFGTLMTDGFFNFFWFVSYIPVI